MRKTSIAGIVYANITRDGMLKGSDLEALKDIDAVMFL